jgi:hypothetical protein
MSGPGHSGLRVKLGSLAGYRWNTDKVVAPRALDLAPGKFFLTSQVLLAMGAFEFELAHGFFDWLLDHFLFQTVNLLADRFGDTVLDLIDVVNGNSETLRHLFGRPILVDVEIEDLKALGINAAL